MKQLFPLAILSAALVGCASTPAPAPTATTVASASKDVVCDRETRTGSMMPTSRCTTAAQREADQKSADNAADFVRRTNQIMPLGK